MPPERGRFGLTFDEREPPIFYGREPNTTEPLPCEKIAAFGMLGYGNELGHLTASVCANGAGRASSRSGHGTALPRS